MRPQAQGRLSHVPAWPILSARASTNIKQSMKATRHVLLALLALFTLVTFFANIGALPTDIMEQRNVVTAREMVDDGCWLVPTMNGALRLEKPPLPTWVAGAIEAVAPGSLSTQRLAAGTMGCLWTWFLFLTARLLARRTDYAMVATVVFLTCYNTVLMGRSATWDIYCHALMMGAIYLLLRALMEERGYRWQLPLAGLLMGLSFLSKGPVSFYALLLPLVLSIVTLPSVSMRGKWPYVALMAVVAVVVGGWWYAYLLLVHGDAVSAVMAKESGAWSNHNVRPWWYYWRFFLEMGAWALPALAALALTYWKHHITLKRTYLITFCWAVGSLLLLSLMPEKKMRYLLPSLAPCAMLVACVMTHLKEVCATGRVDPLGRALYGAQGVLLTIVITAAAVALFVVPAAAVISLAARVVAAVALGVTAVLTMWATLKRKPMVQVAAVALVFATAELLLLPAITRAVGNPASRNIILTVGTPQAKALPLYHAQDTPIRIELVYNAQRKILPIDLNDTANVRAHLPLALVIPASQTERVPATVMAVADTTVMGHYDINLHPKGNRHYTDDLRGRVLRLTAKGGNAGRRAPQPTSNDQ